MNERYTKLATDSWKKMIFNSGIVASNFTPATGAVDEADILFSTTGDISFTAARDVEDGGADVNNCPENTFQLAKAKSWVASLSGTSVNISTSIAKDLLGNADIGATDTSKITPRGVLATTDFADKWFIMNYSDKMGAANGGSVAIHLMNALNVDGISITSSREGNGQMSFNFQAYYDLENPSVVPFEIFVKAGVAEPVAGA